MIFKSLFKPKWQHTDAVIRQAAIAKLDLDANRDVLISIATTDPVAKIRLIALESLNQFDLWRTASEDDSDASVKKTAQSRLVNAFSADNAYALSDEQKQMFISSYKHASLVESLLVHELSTSLVCSIITRLNKDKLNLEYALRSSEDEIALFCFSRLTPEIKTLERLVAKAKSTAVKNKANEQLTAIAEQAEKPKILRKQLNLILSKLLALKEKKDYGQIKSEGEALVEEWSEVSADLPCLPELEQNEYADKYQAICQRIDAATKRLKDEWFAIEAEKQRLIAHQEQVLATQTEIATIKEKIAVAAAGDSDVNVDELNDSVQKIKQSLVAAQISGADVESLFNQIAKLEATLNKLPAFAEQLVAMTKLLTQIAQVSIPETLEMLDETIDVYREWQQSWKTQARQLLLPLPATLTDTYKTVNRQWQDAITQLQAPQKKILDKISSKLRELDKLIVNGKYNAAFGLFRKVSAWHEELTLKNQEKIARDFTKLQEKIDDLADLKEYIAIPRKRELLLEINALVDTPLADPTKQASEVKQLRKVWLLLGSVNTDEDKALNSAFDEASEKAFTPCREHYALQDKIRAENLELKQGIIQELTCLKEAVASEEKALMDIGKDLTNIQNRWSKIGHVNRDVFNDVNDAYYALLKPLKEQLNQLYKNNAAAKQLLIDKAQQVVATAEEQQNFAEAIETLKQLQSQWKTIGFAGGGKDRKQWQAFRKINDDAFAKRSEQAKVEQDARSAQLDSYLQQYSALSQQINDSNNLVTLSPIFAEFEAIAIDEESLSAGQLKKLQQVQLSVQEALINKKSKFEQNKSHAVYQLIFEQVNNIANEIETDLTELPSQWQELLTTYSQSTADDACQYDLTIKLELTTEQESPAADKNRRMALQVQMLASKHNDGDLQSPESLFKQWLAMGRSSHPELLTRAIKAFSASL
ncbi:DUF349 domain-containing protein [Algibacillus agarilyticus]|uniref:DUF349 domain-containing protein n=1 Tax=Algibacillus agarilyticus TaxID=2234133 RepID=UPI000DCF735E|nr:DUF349 domain-containing protein [Algibacillus agarilyticus]